MKEIYLIRHAESIYNENPENDNYDCALSLLGESQCVTLGNKLEKVHFDCIFVSPLRKCIQTLNLSKISHEKSVIIDMCREYKTNKCDFLEGEAINYETECEIIERTEAFKLFLKSINDYDKIAVISHADFIFYLTAKLVDGELFGIWLENSDYHIISI